MFTSVSQFSLQSDIYPHFIPCWLILPTMVLSRGHRAGQESFFTS
ncbi:Uncharacterised protein [Edwardsiella ictaluri]|nr:Uncharacterised protein [Edwardsiella ictaluri]